jgi:putative phosphoesterase
MGGRRTQAELCSAGQVRTPAPTRAVVNIGVISDTHGLLRPEALAALRGSDYIIHAGDIGDAAILKKLAEIAPVTAIRGNVDRDGWARKVPATDVLEIGGVLIYVLHNLQELDLRPEAAGFAVVISGHSHVPKQQEKNGVLYFNPGSAGPRRFRLPVTIGRLKMQGGKVSGEIVEILPGAR